MYRIRSASPIPIRNINSPNGSGETGKNTVPLVAYATSNHTDTAAISSADTPTTAFLTLSVLISSRILAAIKGNIIRKNNRFTQNPSNIPFDIYHY